MVGAILVVFVALVVGAALFFCEPAPSLPPSRPTTVPQTAVWGGGEDGGFWLDCAIIQGQSPRLACRVYHDWTGELEVRGDFVSSDGDATRIGQWRGFLGFDGTTIMMPGDRSLVPDGWLEFPSVRKRQLFRKGAAVSGEEPMPTPGSEQ